MKKLRFFDSLKLVLATVACMFILNVAHADNTWKYAPLPIGYAVDSDLVELTESNESFNTYTVKETKNTAKRMLYITNANPLPANHKYFMRVRFNSNLASLPYFRYMLDGTYTNLGYGSGYNTSCRNNEWCNVTQIITPQQELNLNGVSDGLLAASNSYTAGETITIDKNGFLTVFDLTEIFGAGNEPTTVADAEQALSIDTTIKIATTRYNEEQFEPVQNRLSDAMNAVDDVVTRTMTQAQAIDQIANEKQTRPDEGCNAKYCLLVEDEDGTPHWYPIAGANGVEYVLPSGYTKLEYLKKAEMSQYIQTNYIGNLKSRYEGAIYIGNDVSYWTRDAYYIASRETENGYNRNIALAGSSGGFYVGYGGFVSTNRFSLVQGKKVDFITDYVNRTWSVNIDGVAQTETISSNAIVTSFVNTAPLQIFFVKTQDYPDDYVTYSSFPGVRVYYLRIYEDNSLVHEFIPVRRDSDGVLGMYDLVDANPATAFYINSGTGEFVAGPDM